MGIKENIGKKLRLYRNRARMTQEDLASSLGVTNTTISNYETGYSMPDVETLIKAANALGVTVEMLLGETPYQMEVPLGTNPDGKMVILKGMWVDSVYEPAASYLPDIVDVLNQAVEDGIIKPEDLPDRIDFVKKVLESHLDQERKRIEREERNKKPNQRE